MNLIKLWLLNAVYSVILFYYIIKLYWLGKVNEALGDAAAELKALERLPYNIEYSIVLELLDKNTYKMQRTRAIVEHGYATLDDNYNQIEMYKG